MVFLAPELLNDYKVARLNGMQQPFGGWSTDRGVVVQVEVKVEVAVGIKWKREQE